MMDLDSPEAKLPIINKPIAVANVALRPKILSVGTVGVHFTVISVYAYSEKRPYNGWKAVEVSNVADGTHEAIEPALKKDEIVGRAVATIVESNADTTMHPANPRNTTRILRKGRRLVWSVS